MKPKLVRELASEVYPEERVHRTALKCLGGVATAAIIGVVVMAFCGHDMAASSLVAVATAAVTGMAAVFK